MKKTVILGATDDPSRYAFKAANMLKKHGHPIVPVGKKQGAVAGEQIRLDQPLEQGVDTVTLYVGTRNQQPLYDYIMKLNPKRIIFNPGTENPELEEMAEQRGIEAVEGCTLVMLSIGLY
jgi:uncharacterized protein